MNLAKSTAALMGAFTLSTLVAQGQAQLRFADIKNFQQVGPEDSIYLGGSWNIALNDGSFGVLGCAFNGGFQFVAPNIACPSGTTGLITQGDIDEDGLRDTAQYFSITQPQRAVAVEPFQTNLVELFAAPQSDLPRPLGGFNWIDTSVVVFFDQVNDPINGLGYEITRYNSSRPYNDNELLRHREEIVPGVYQFKFPALGSDANAPRNFFMQVGHREMVEAFPGPGGSSVSSSGISIGNDFRVTNDDRWRGDRMEFDPRLVFDFQWEGLNPSTFVNGDRTFFAVRERATDLIVFPPFPDAINRDFPQLIGSNGLGIATGYELGPDFFQPGRELYIEVEHRRNNGNNIIADISRRFFRWDVDLIDTYAGFQRAAFPAGTDDFLVEPGSDFDGDGFTNLQEFGLQTDLLDPADVPNITPTLDPFTNQCVLRVPKRPNIGSSLTYQIQYSFDLETWITITRNDPVWFVQLDNNDVIQVISRRESDVTSCLLRVRFVQND